MPARISPMLAVDDPAAAIDFYRRAFAAEIRWCIGDPAEVAELLIEGASLFLARHSPPHGTRSPGAVGSTSVRIELFVDDPRATQHRALAAGAREGNPVEEHTHAITGAASPLRLLQGRVTDPFGHQWLIGRFLE